MASLRNKRKLAPIDGDNHVESAGDNQLGKSAVPRINLEYISQVFEQIDGRAKMNFIQKFSHAVSLILGALSIFDNCFLKPQIRLDPGSVPVIFRKTNVEEQEPTEDRSFFTHPSPEVKTLVHRSALRFQAETRHPTNIFEAKLNPGIKLSLPLKNM